MEHYIDALKNYANFNGRWTRKQYWMFFLFNFIISFALGFVGGLIKFELIGTIYSLALLIPGIAAGVRRLHDVGKSGIFLIIPLYNLILLCTASEQTDNGYGPLQVTP